MEQLAVHMPHSKQYLSFSASRILLRTSLETAVTELAKFLALPCIGEAQHIKVYKRKGFSWTSKLTGEPNTLLNPKKQKRPAQEGRSK